MGATEVFLTMGSLGSVPSEADTAQTPRTWIKKKKLSSKFQIVNSKKIRRKISKLAVPLASHRMENFCFCLLKEHYLL